VYGILMTVSGSGFGFLNPLRGMTLIPGGYLLRHLARRRLSSACSWRLCRRLLRISCCRTILVRFFMFRQLSAISGSVLTLRCCWWRPRKRRPPEDHAVNSLGAENGSLGCLPNSLSQCSSNSCFVSEICMNARSTVSCWSR